MNPLDVWKRLPLAVRIALGAGVLALALVVLENRGLVDNLVHLLQAAPPILYLPIRTGSAPLPSEQQKPAHSSAPQTEKLSE